MSISQEGIYFFNEGSKLLGTFYAAAGDEPKPTAIVLHGVPGIEKNADLAHALRDAGVNACVFHYRGCWGSEGNYTFEGIPADVRACLDHLEARPDVDAKRFLLIGHSMGGWAAVMAGADPRVLGVAAIAAAVEPARVDFSEADAEASFTPWLVGMEPAAFVRQWTEATPTTLVVGDLGKPLLVVHADDDEVLPVEQARLLFEAAAEPKRLELRAHGGHGFLEDRPWLVDTVTAWVGEVLGQST